MATYIAESDFYRYAPEASEFFNSHRPIYGWGAVVSSVYPAYMTGSITVLFQDGKDLGAAQANIGAVDAEGEWFYDADTDKLSLYTATDPNTQELLAGEDHATYSAAIRLAASRLLDSRVDTSHQTPFAKSKDGTFDEIIIEATSYYLGSLVTKGRDPVLSAMYRDQLFNIDKTGIIDQINAGSIKLASEVDADSHMGEIREVSVSGDVHLTRSRGAYSGSGHDRLKIIVSTAGVAGTGKFKVFGYDDNTDTPKSLEWIDTDGELIEFYQWHSIGNGLQIMFEGDDGASATADDEWELEIHGVDSDVTNPGFNSMQADRY